MVAGGTALDTTKKYLHLQHLQLHHRMYFLRGLRLYGDNSKLLFLFYQGILESVVYSYSIQVRYGNLSAQLKSKLAHHIKMALKTIEACAPNYLQFLNEKCVFREAQKTLDDPTHILSPEYERLPSGRRLRMPKCRMNRYKNSFILSSIKLLNINKSSSTL